MSVIKSFAVGDGDNFYIRHNSDSFTIIDASLPADRREEILADIQDASGTKGITRLIATQPEADHVGGLHHLDDTIGIVNFYCVENSARTDPDNEGVERYRLLHDSDEAFYLTDGCHRRWMNQTSDERGSAGINILWPDRSHESFKTALDEAEKGRSANNICPIASYSLKGGASAVWFGDLETDFLDSIEDAVSIKPTSIVFAPHHGRESGKLPNSWLEALDPKIVVIGEAASAHLDYYDGYNTITQNSAGDIAFECTGQRVHVHVSSETYTVGFLDDDGETDLPGMRYLGSVAV